MKEKNPTAHIVETLRQVGICPKLTTPPREYTAMLMTPEGAGVSFSFLIPNRNLTGVTHINVIKTLLEAYFKKNIYAGELSASTLEYKIDAHEEYHKDYPHEKPEQKNSIQLKGSEIRYQITPPKRGNHQWQYLDDSVSIFIDFRKTLEADKETFEKNKETAFQELEKLQKEAEALIEATKDRITKIMEATRKIADMHIE